MVRCELAVVGGEVVLADGRLARVDVGVAGGRIVALADGGLDAPERIDAHGLTVLPGCVDEHFHVFRGFGWETYENATRSAAKGGITTVVDMPLDRPATVTRALFEAKLAAIAGSCHVDFALFGGGPAEDLSEVEELARAGASAIKLFTGGVAPPGMYPGADTGEILDCFRRAAAVGVPVVVHAENAEIVDAETTRVQASGRADPLAWDEARPWFSELEAVMRVTLLAEVTGARAILAHLTAPESVDHVAAARRRGIDVWAETCPHYLCLTTEDMAGDGRLKWNPPSRDRASVERLWEQVASGAIHAIGSDHAPLPKAPGADVWAQLPGAGNGVEAMLPLIATEALARGLGIGRVVDALATAPARAMGLYPRKGVIAVGSDADLALVDLGARRRLDASRIEYHEQEPWSPFDGRELTAWPRYTVLRGRTIVAEGEVRGQPGDGVFLPGPASRAAAEGRCS